MAITIERPIVAVAVAPSAAPAPSAVPQTVHERLPRPQTLHGTTYKIKTPLHEHALYVTINDIVLNAGTAHESRRPFELFINSKNMEHFQWIVALTLIVSAVFRKGGDIAFLVEELASVFDPKGGYFRKGGPYIPSVVAEIGLTLATHLHAIGIIDSPNPFAEQAPRGNGAPPAPDAQRTPADGYPPEATLCGRCHHRAVIIAQGCHTCLACGDSKCA